jgi:hypothetical protein
MTRPTDDAPPVSPLGLLVSYASGATTVGRTIEHATRHRLPLIVDSGAFTAHTTGRPIDLAAHTAYVHAHQGTPGVRWVGLDVLGDPAATRRNWLKQRDHDAPVEPTIHYGTDPAEIDRYLRAGLATGTDGKQWVNLGGMVAETKPSAYPRLAAWCAAVAQRIPEDQRDRVRLHGLGCTPPRLNRLFGYDSIDSIYWQATIVRHRHLSLFDPLLGDWRIFYVNHTNPRQRATSWRGAYAHGRFLRTVYGTTPREIVDGPDIALKTLAARSAVRMAAYMRKRHGTELTIHLAGATYGQIPMIAAEARALTGADTKERV